MKDANENAGVARWPWVALAAAVVGTMILLINGALGGRTELVRFPTGSMSPTLRGGDGETPGDLVLVDLDAYEHAGPARWDVAMFRYPLNRSRRFMKRVVGLPGEHLRIYEGDIWVRPKGASEYKVPQRSRATRLVQSFPVYPDPQPRSDPMATYWDPAPASAVWTVPSVSEIKFAGGAEASLRSRHRILQNSDAATWGRRAYGSPVRDVRIRFTLRIAPEADQPGDATCRVTWRCNARTEASIVLSQKSAEASITSGQAPPITKALGVRLAGGAVVTCELEYVDARLYVWIDDELVANLREDRRPSAAEVVDENQRLAFALAGPPMTIEKLTIHRDLWYGNDWTDVANPEWARTGIALPSNAYFVLGDNSGSSSDSRSWRQVDIHLKDGRVLHFDDFDIPEFVAAKDGRELIRRVDVDGKTWTWSEDDVNPERGRENRAAPFVLGRDFQGKALRVVGPGPERTIH